MTVINFPQKDAAEDENETKLKPGDVDLAAVNTLLEAHKEFLNGTNRGAVVISWDEAEKKFDFYVSIPVGEEITDFVPKLIVGLRNAEEFLREYQNTNGFEDMDMDE